MSEQCSKEDCTTPREMPSAFCEKHLREWREGKIELNNKVEQNNFTLSIKDFHRYKNDSNETYNSVEGIYFGTVSLLFVISLASLIMGELLLLIFSVFTIFSLKYTHDIWKNFAVNFTFLNRLRLDSKFREHNDIFVDEEKLGKLTMEIEQVTERLRKSQEKYNAMVEKEEKRKKAAADKKMLREEKRMKKQEEKKMKEYIRLQEEKNQIELIENLRKEIAFLKHMNSEKDREINDLMDKKRPPKPDFKPENK